MITLALQIKEMKKITEFTPDNLKELRAEMQNAMNTVAEKFGLQKIALGKIGYESHLFKVQVIAEVDASKNDHAKEIHKRDSGFLGYDDSIIGLVYKEQNGKEFRVTKIDINRPKYAIVADCLSDGKSYKRSAKTPLNFVDATVKYEAGKNLYLNS